jgi:ring-1,2-phenylacetyl-CoA epoxidase subunit PaaC
MQRGEAMMRVENASKAKENKEYCAALVDFLYRLADDEFILGHRISEWLGVAPDIEEDIAFSSVCQDEIGHATLYYNFLSELGEGKPDDLALGRKAEKFRNARFLERPNGDWAHAITRGYLYDVYESVLIEALTHSSYVPLSLGAAKVQREERYHYLHMETWFKRLAIAEGEAKERLEKAIAGIWPDLFDFIAIGAHESVLLTEGILPIDANGLYTKWEEIVKRMFDSVGLAWPGSPLKYSQQDIYRSEHTSDLEKLLEVACEVYRLDPAANW